MSRKCPRVGKRGGSWGGWGLTLLEGDGWEEIFWILVQLWESSGSHWGAPKPNMSSKEVLGCFLGTRTFWNEMVIPAP